MFCTYKLICSILLINITNNYFTVSSQKSVQFSLSDIIGSQSSKGSDLKRTHSDFEDDLPEIKIRKKSIMTPELVSALDRNQISNRQAMHIISAVLLSLGLDINDYNLSYSTILNARNKFRKEIVEKIKNDMELSKCLIVHWDGKLLPTDFSKKKVERLPIAVTGVNTNQLLAAPLVYEATGISEAEVVFEVLNEWNIVDSIKGMCFDTPAVNTGKLLFEISYVNSKFIIILILLLSLIFSNLNSFFYWS